MREIDKTNRLSTVYTNWEAVLETNKEAHPKYNSSANEHYYHVVMDLLRCQNGLCAYTEVRLCPPIFYDASYWENGKYNTTDWQKIVPYEGQLEHFDESLKSKKADKKGRKDWLWDNFFMVQSDTNRIKGRKKVASFLKPDIKDYTPQKYFSYNQNTHRFEPKKDLDETQKQSIVESLDVLGINHPTIIHKRQLTVEAFFKYGVPNDEFPTAIAFCESEI